MSLSSIPLSLLEPVGANVSNSLARAKELLDLIKSPTAIATGVLLVFARGQLARNAATGVDKPMTRWALAASLGALAIAAVIVGVMSPLAYRMVFVNRGGVETELLVYGLTYLVAFGTTIYAAYIVWSCRGDL